jgi:hypothetical protein
MSESIISFLARRRHPTPRLSRETGRGRILVLVLSAHTVLWGCTEGYPTEDLKPDPRTHVLTQADIMQALNETGHSPSAQGRWTYRFHAPCGVAVEHESKTSGESRRLVDLTGQLLEVMSGDESHSVLLASQGPGKERAEVLFIGRSRVSAMDIHTWLRRLRGTCPDSSGVSTGTGG